MTSSDSAPATLMETAHEATAPATVQDVHGSPGANRIFTVAAPAGESANETPATVVRLRGSTRRAEIV